MEMHFVFSRSENDPICLYVSLKWSANYINIIVRGGVLIEYLLPEILVKGFPSHGLDLVYISLHFVNRSVTLKKHKHNQDSLKFWLYLWQNSYPCRLRSCRKWSGASGWICAKRTRHKASTAVDTKGYEAIRSQSELLHLIL